MQADLPRFSKSQIHKLSATGWLAKISTRLYACTFQSEMPPEGRIRILDINVLFRSYLSAYVSILLISRFRLQASPSWGSGMSQHQMRKLPPRCCR